MNHHSQHIVAVLLTVALLTLATLPASAVTWFTANGLTSGTINTPGPLTVRSDASATGAKVYYVVGSDLNGSGLLEAGEPVLANLGAVQEGGWMDEDAANGVVQTSVYIPQMVGGPVVLQAIDQNGTTVGHAYSMNYLHPGQSIAGTVLYNDGSPAAGVMVSTAMGEEGRTAYFTNAAGGYVLYLPVGQHLIGAMNSTESDGAAAGSQRGVPVLEWVKLNAAQAKTGINFMMYLAPGPTITGQVTEGDTGRPVPGVPIEATNVSTYEEAVAMTDVNGNYTLHVSSGTWEVATDVWAYDRPYTDPPPQTVPVVADDVVANFDLPRFANCIYGIVTGGGAPLATGYVVAESQAAPDWYESPTNAQGHYEVWAPADSYWVGAEDDNGNYIMSATGMADVTVPPNTQANLTLVPCSYTLSGRVTFNGTTTGVPNVDIWLDDVSMAYAWGLWATTDSQGYYSLKVPAGDFDVTAEAWMYDWWSDPVSLTFGPDHTNVNFSVTPAHGAPTLTAAAVDPATGVTGQTLTFTVKYTSADNTPPMDVCVFIDSWPKPMEPVDPLDFSYSDGATFEYETTLGAGTHSFWFGTIDQMLLQTRQPAGDLSVVVTAGGIISGTVTDAVSHAAVADVGVHVELATAPYTSMGTTTTDASGGYSFSLAPGSYLVRCIATGYMTASVSPVPVTANQTTTRNFALSRSAILAGQVTTSPGGTPIEGAWISAKLNDSILESTTATDAAGNYRIDTNLTPGTYTIAVSKRYYNTVTATGVSLPAGVTTTRNVALTATGELTGQVKASADSSNLAGAEVKAYLGGVLKGTGTSAANGVYQITQGLPSGSYVVVASKSGFVSQTKSSISVTTGATSYCNFSLGVSGTISGQVKEKGTNVNLAGAQVKAYLGGVLKATATTAANGVYTIASDLAAGTYAVTATKTGYVTQTKSNIAVSTGATTYVNFFLGPLLLTGQVRVAGTSTNIAGATVTVYEGDVVKATATTNANGIYEIGGVVTGSYTVVASKAGYVRQSKPNITITQGLVTYLNFGLAISGKLRGQVKNQSNGTPIIGATVVARLGGVVRGTAITGAYGVYEIASDLPAGTYVTGASMTGFLGQTRKDIVVTAGVTTFVNFNLVPQVD